MQRMKAIIFTTVAGVGLALFAALPISVQADGGDTTLIHACVAKDGTMRIVSATTTCKTSETPLHWVNVARVSAIESKNTTQDSSISAVQTKNASQDTSISAIQTKDTQQDAAIQALQGQTGGGLRVVDSLGQEVGPLISSGFAGVKIGNLVAVVNITPDSIQDNAAFLNFFHTSTNCSGTRYLFNSGQIPGPGSVVSGTLYFPVQPYQQLTINSVELFNQGDDVSQPGQCSQAGPQTGGFGTVGTFTLPTFTPPLHVE